MNCQFWPSHCPQVLGKPAKAPKSVAHSKPKHTKRGIPSWAVAENLIKDRTPYGKNASKGGGRTCDVARCSDVRTTDRPGFKRWGTRYVPYQLGSERSQTRSAGRIDSVKQER